MKLGAYLTKEERASFRSSSDAVASAVVAANLAIVAFAFVSFGLWPNPVTFIVSVCLLAGRFVGLGVLNHDAAHNALFATRGLNRAVARWLFAAPTLIDFDAYRHGHLSHHKHAGSLEDPDLPFVRNYPVERASMRRKLMRDLTGRTGLRDTAYLIAMTIKGRRWRPLVVHAATFALLAAAGMPWAYALWWVAVVFVVPVCLRIRVMGEHGNVTDLLSADVREHARTTRAGWLARAFIAPNYVNYHCEHHFFANVPGYKLPLLHRLLTERGFYEDHPGALATGYLEVVRACVGTRTDRPDFSGVERGGASLSNMA